MFNRKEETKDTSELSGSPKTSPTKSSSIKSSPASVSLVKDEEEVIETPHTEDGSTEDDDEEISLGAAVAGFSSWFTSTMSTAKEKSSEMFQYLKQDFSEFSDTVSEASKDLKDKLKLEDTAKSAVQTISTKANIVLDQMSTIFGVGPDDEDEEAIVMRSGEPVVVDRVKVLKLHCKRKLAVRTIHNHMCLDLQAKIYSLAVEDECFLKDPDDIKAYENWLLTFDLEKKNIEMADLLTANPHLQLAYGKLVPDKVSHLVFWHRFYYRVHEMCRADGKEGKKIGGGDAKEDNSDVEKDDRSPSTLTNLFID